MRRFSKLRCGSQTVTQIVWMEDNRAVPLMLLHLNYIKICKKFSVDISGLFCRILVHEKVYLSLK